MSGPEVIVIGGGLHGLSAALELARRGRRVRVLEAVRIAAHASGYSAGGVRTLGRHMAEVPLAVAAIERWHDIGAMLGDDCGFRASGQVKIAEDAADLVVLEDRAALLRAAGYAHEEVIDQAELRRLLPAVAAQAVGGMVTRRDGFAAPLRTTLAFARAARAAGAEIIEGIRVAGLDRAGGQWRVQGEDGSVHEAPLVVNAAGAWGGRIARRVGEEIPFGFNAFMMMLTSRLPPFVGPVVGATARALSFKQTETGQAMIGGGHKGVGSLETGAVRLDVRRLAYSARTAMEIFPILREAKVVHAWAGIEGVTPDEIPVLGPATRAEGLVHAFGFCGHGFALSPVTGGMVADLLLDGRTALPVAPFAADRFGRAAAAGPTALPQPAG